MLILIYTKKDIKMTTLQSYISIYKNKPIYELKHIKKALSVCNGFFNSSDDDIRLKAVNLILKNK